MALKKRLGITAFDLYTDKGGAASQAWKVWDAETEISLAASFVVEPGGKVIFRFVGADKTDRPSVDAILAAVK